MTCINRFILLLCVVVMQACTTIPNQIYPPLTASSKHRVIKSPRVALVLGGGGARSFAHLGVIKALEEAHIPIDLIVGTSAGSIVGGLYAANPHIDQTTEIMMKSSYLDYIDFSLRDALSGPIPGHHLQKFIINNTPIQRIENLKIPFIAVATELNSGKTIALQRGSLAIAINASCALPTLVHPVQFCNAILVDGGVTDPIPVDIAKKFHPKIIIAVNIACDAKSNVKLTMTNIMSQSLNLMTTALTRYNLRGADVVIRPKVGYISLFDLSKKQQLYQEGLVAGRKAIPAIRKLLNKYSDPQSSISIKQM